MYGSSWAFHGTRLENLYPILNHGFVGAMNRYVDLLILFKATHDYPHEPIHTHTNKHTHTHIYIRVLLEGWLSHFP